MEILEHLQKNLTEVFKGLFAKVQIIEDSLEIPKDSYDSIRKQYVSALFLHAVRTYAVKYNYDKILGITALDLFVYELNFVFGQAEFGSHARGAIISLYRLYPEFYGQPPQRDLFLLRVVKEGIHEIGHMLGLEHCRNNCIMMFSNSIWDTDKKPIFFCDKCRKKISKF